MRAETRIDYMKYLRKDRGVSLVDARNALAAEEEEAASILLALAADLRFNPYCDRSTVGSKALRYASVFVYPREVEE